MKTLKITVSWEPVECGTPTWAILKALISENLPEVVEELESDSAKLPIVADQLYDHRGDELGQFSIEEEGED